MPRLLLSALLLLAGSTLAQDRPPNVVLLLIDDLGWTDLATQGSKFHETPHLDQLARDGMRFTSAYAACTVCSPTRAAVLTGKSPARLHLTDWIAGHQRPFARLKIPDWTQALPKEETTLAEHLKVRGYATASIGKWHLGPDAPEAHGFDRNLGGYEAGQPPSYFSPYKIPTLKDGPEGEFLTDRLTEETVGFIREHKDKPFFVYLPHYAVHTPIQAKANVIAKYRAKGPAGHHHDPAYAALVESVDDSVGRLRAVLQELGLTDNTLFIFTSDNGGLSHLVGPQGWRRGPTDNSPLRLGKGSAYEGGMRVPLLIAWPGVIEPGSACDTPVISHDLAPTVLAATGITPGAEIVFDGVSLMPLLTQKDILARDAIYWHYPHYHPGGASPYSALRAGDWKLMLHHEDNRLELYNLRRDPGEAVNLAEAEADIATALHQQLQSWLTQVNAQLPEPNPAHDPERIWESPRTKVRKEGES
jgi:arylsulfatase A